VNTFDETGRDLSPQQVAELLESGEGQLVDVREPYEWDAGRIAGARHIELERLAGRAAELPRERPVVFLCRLGARSAMATQAFRAAGWDAYNLSGGIRRWADRGLPLEPAGGQVADH
jgi:rhodanese-related sulfurtransferase